MAGIVDGFELEELETNINVQPYQFEPLPSARKTRNKSEVSDSDTEDQQQPAVLSDSGDDADRLSNTFWCECGECQTMSSVKECLCCCEVGVVYQTMQLEPLEIECITKHQTFVDNCLNRRVLEVSLYQYVELEGPLDDNKPIHRVYRHVAYRRFVQWIWQRLGRGNRRILPSCVVRKIRESFPSEQYTGFMYARPK